MFATVSHAIKIQTNTFTTLHPKPYPPLLDPPEARPHQGSGGVVQASSLFAPVQVNMVLRLWLLLVLLLLICVSLLLILLFTWPRCRSAWRVSAMPWRRCGRRIYYVYIYIYIYRCIHIYYMICMYVYMYIYIYVHTYSMICIYIYIYIYAYTHIHIYTHTYTHMYTIYIYIYVYTHIHIHISLSLYIYIYIHIYIHTYICYDIIWGCRMNKGAWSSRVHLLKINMDITRVCSLPAFSKHPLFVLARGGQYSSDNKQTVHLGEPMVWQTTASRYTRSPLEDSRLFGPSPWKFLRHYLWTNGFLSNPALGENIVSGNLVMETGRTAINRIAIITAINRIAIITAINRIAIITASR